MNKDGKVIAETLLNYAEVEEENYVLCILQLLERNFGSSVSAGIEMWRWKYKNIKINNKGRELTILPFWFYCFCSKGVFLCSLRFSIKQKQR
jgi:hypothetical protein